MSYLDEPAELPRLGEAKDIREIQASPSIGLCYVPYIRARCSNFAKQIKRVTGFTGKTVMCLYKLTRILRQ